MAVDEIVELDVGLASLDAWRALTAAHPFTGDRSAVQAIVDHARQFGVVSPDLGRVGPEGIEVAGPNYRESFKVNGINARSRALLDYLAQMPGATARTRQRIFAPEALTPFALRLRGLYPRFYGSEYLPDKASRERLFPIPHENLEALSFPDAAFDVALCNDVFEHVADLPRCLSELSRILTQGGTLLATFPFAYNQTETIVKARRRGGAVQIVGEAEYHDDPLDPAGALVFQIPGWDILETARAAGFSMAEMRFVSSRTRGLCASELAGILFLRAVR